MVLRQHCCRSLAPFARDTKTLKQILAIRLHNPLASRNHRILLRRYARSMYLPVRVSILIFSPVLMNNGACTVMPVSTVMVF